MGKFNKVVVGLLVLLLVVSFVNYANLKNEIKNMRSEIVGLQVQNNNQINNISNQVRNSLNEFEQENTWFRTSDYEIYDVDETFENVKVKYKVKLNQFSNEDKVFLSLISEENNNIEKLEMKQLEGNLIFEVNMTLSSNDNYEVEILKENNETILSKEVYPIALKDELDHAIFIDGFFLDVRYDKNKEETILSFMFNIMNNFDSSSFEKFGMPLNIKKSTAEIYVNRELIDEIDLGKVELLTGKQLEQKYDEDSIEDEIIEYKFKIDGKDIADEDCAIIIKLIDNYGREHKGLVIDPWNDEDREYFEAMINTIK